MGTQGGELAAGRIARWKSRRPVDDALPCAALVVPRLTQTNRKTKHVLKEPLKKLNLLLIGAALALPAMSRAAINKRIEGSPRHLSGTNHTRNSRHGVRPPLHS